MPTTNLLGSPVRSVLGATTVSTVITLTVLVVLGAGGWIGYSYYRLLGKSQKVERSLSSVHRFRGGDSVTRARILASAQEKIRAAGGKLEARDISLTLSSLTASNGQQLPRPMRTKLSLLCHTSKLHAQRDSRLDRLKRQYADAHRGPGRAPRRDLKPPRPAPAAPAAPPDLKGGLGCSAERLAELNYTFGSISAKVTVRSGLFRRTVSVKQAFYLPQPPGAANPAAANSDADEDADDDE